MCERERKRISWYYISTSRMRRHAPWKKKRGRKGEREKKRLDLV